MVVKTYNISTNILKILKFESKTTCSMLFFPENMTVWLSIDEILFNGELPPLFLLILTKKVKGTIVAMIAGTKANGYIHIEKSLLQRNKIPK
jgi:hypothetical protein